MFKLVILPSEVAEKEYLSLPSTKTLKFSRLIFYEDRLREITSNFQKQLRNLSLKLENLGNLFQGSSIERLITGFQFSSDIWDTNKSIESIIEHLQNSYSEKKKSIDERTMEYEKSVQKFKKNIFGNINLTDSHVVFRNSRTEGIGNISMVDINSIINSKNRYEYIDCFICSVSKENLPGFKQLLKSLDYPNYFSRLEKDFYIIYCLKQNTKEFIKKIQKFYFCEDPSNLYENTELDELMARNKYMIFLITKLAESGDLYLHSVFLQGYIESISRYGPPLNYRFKILEGRNKKIKKELKHISSIFTNSQSSEKEEEYPFTCIEIVEEFYSK